MALTDEQRAVIGEFRTYIESHVPEGLKGVSVVREDREDESTLASRWAVGEHVWYEVALRPLLPQVRVGVVTDDRWKSEDFEQKIEDSGDTMSEYVELGFETAGLEWSEPPVEHYREQGKYFYFATPLELERLADLTKDETRGKVVAMLTGYLQAFGEADE